MSQTVARVVFRSFISTGIVCNEYYFGDQNRGQLLVYINLGVKIAVIGDLPPQVNIKYIGSVTSLPVEGSFTY